jgi:hypothetical protein
MSVRCGLGSSGSGEGPEAGSSKHGNDVFSSVNMGNVFTCWAIVFEKDGAP